jgi:hypothetical protein
VDTAARAHLIRVVRLTVAAVIVETCLVGIARLQPAMGGLLRSVYWLVGGVFAVLIFRALRKRSGRERRHGERRHSAPVD